MGILNLTWLHSFGALHERAKRGGLKGCELKSYRKEREEMERALLAAQNLALQPGQTPRRALRIARALVADIDFRDRVLCAPTLDISAGGFAVLLPFSPQVADEADVTLGLPGGEPLRARVRVVDVGQYRGGGARVGYQFVVIDEADAERLKMFIFDHILKHLKG